MKKSPLVQKPAVTLKQIPVVGIGASAGGLDAFKKLLKAIPPKSGMAYIIIQHFDAKHESVLKSLLQNFTSVPITQITGQTKIQPDRIYIVPSNKMLGIKENKFLLKPRPTKNSTLRNQVIDLFFSSLAQVCESHAIGVILSGNSSDGTMGLKAIKDHGGVTIAQSQTSAAYEDMPHSAITAGFADFVLAPEKIPQKLIDISKAILNKEPTEINARDEAVFVQILSILRLRKGMDFTYYKQTTIRRRIIRRMVLNKYKTISAYAKYLEGNLAEQDALYQDMLIPVTSFFRDKKVFDNLCESVFPALIKNKTAEGIIRIWVAGCSTGEEAYSIAICFKEYLGIKKEKIQIFATDLNEVAIAKARTGIYSKADAEAVSPGRLKEYFTYTQGGYQVNKELRDICVFAVHNFLKDPPFGRIDFISCRNVLIYMDTYLQRRALATFHYALNPKGLIMLGKSENTVGITDLFIPSGKSEKIFIKKDVPTKIVPVMSRQTVKTLPEVKNTVATEIVRTDFQKIADDIILKEFIPAAVVVNESLDIVHFRGVTSFYLEQSPGKPSHNLLKMAKMGLAFELRSILHKVRKDKKVHKKTNIPVSLKKVQYNINIEARPLPNTIEPFYLIIFEHQIVNKNKIAPAKNKGKIKKDDYTIRIHQLEQELALLREDMRTITEDQEASNEELQSTNEELLSSNEELQSLNEELETSKEELQSTIEELTVVNQEMVNLNEQLAIEKEYADITRKKLEESEEKFRTMAESSDILIGVNNETIDAVYFNKPWEKLTGRSVEDLLNLGWADLLHPDDREPFMNKFLTAYENKVSYDGEFRMLNKDGEYSWLYAKVAVRLHPDGSYAGHISSCIDITERKKNETALKHSEAKYRTLFESMDQGFSIIEMIFDKAGKPVDYLFVEVNPVFEKQTGLKNAVGKTARQLIPNLEEHWFKTYGDIAITGKPAQFIQESKAMGRWFDVYAFATGGEGSNKVAILFTDITEKRKADESLKANEKRYTNLLLQSPFAFAIFKGSDMIIELANQQMKAVLGKGDNIEGKPLMKVLPELKDQPFPKYLADVYATGIPFMANEALCKLYRNGKMEDAYFNFVYQPFRDIDDSIIGITCIAYESTNEVLAKHKIEASEKYFRQLTDTVPSILWITEPDGYCSYLNKNWYDYTGQTEKEGEGYGWLNATHPDDAKAAREAFIYANNTQQPFNHTYRLKTKNGYRWAIDRGTPKFSADGKYEGMIGTVVDIHEEKIAIDKLKENEAELRKTTEHFEIATRSAEVGVWSLDVATETLVWSALHKKMWGYDEKRMDLVYEDWHKIILEADKEAAFAEVEKARKTRSPYEAIYRIKRPDNGEIRWMRSTGQYFYDENGNAVTLTGVSIDITEIKKAEDILRQSEENFRQLSDLFPGKINVADETGNVHYYNETWVQFTGLSRDELINQGWQQAIHPDELESITQQWQQAVQTGTELELELRMRNIVGEYIWHLTRVKPVKNKQGNVTKWISSMTEIQKIKEEEERKDNFLKMVSHELKTPVTSVKGYVQLLLNILKEQQEVPSAYLETPLLRIDNQVGRLGNLISEMLDLTRLDTGKLEFSKELFDLKTLVADTIQDISFTNNSHTITFLKKVKANIFADRNRIGQVIINLINNAIKYSPGNNKIDVSMELTGNGMVAVSISDYGIGIEKDHLSKIFERFYRVGGESQKNYAGFGIGLFIASEIIERHEGTINVTSEKDKGSTFTFTLPLST